MPNAEIFTGRSHTRQQFVKQYRNDFKEAQCEKGTFQILIL